MHFGVELEIDGEPGSIVRTVVTHDFGWSLKMMKFAALVVTIVMWLSVMRILAQDRIIDDRDVRRHVAWLITEQFDLDQAKAHKLNAALSAKSIPLWRNHAETYYPGPISIRVLDELLTSRNGLSVLIEILNLEQLGAFFEMISMRKERAIQANVNRTVAVLDQVLSLLPKQREQISSVMRRRAQRLLLYRHYQDLLHERRVILEDLVSNENYSFDQFLSERQIKVKRLILDVYLWGDIHMQPFHEPPLVGDELIDWQMAHHWDDEAKTILIMEMRRPELGWEEFSNDDPEKIAGLNIMERSIRKRTAQEVDRNVFLRNLMLDTDLIFDIVKEEVGEDRNLLEDFAIAVLEANTERLGELEVEANKRLMLARRGTYRQIFNEEKTKTKARVADNLHKPVDRNFRMLFGGIRQEIPESRRMPEYTLPMFERFLRGLEDHSLYRQTIEGVLSPEAYEVYSTAQQERKSFQLAAKRKAVLAATGFVFVVE